MIWIVNRNLIFSNNSIIPVEQQDSNIPVEQQDITAIKFMDHCSQLVVVLAPHVDVLSLVAFYENLPSIRILSVFVPPW